MKKQNQKWTPRVPPNWYTSHQMLVEADWMWWRGEYDLAWETMHIIADRASQEHEAYGKMEREVEEVGEATATSLKPTAGEHVGGNHGEEN